MGRVRNYPLRLVPKTAPIKNPRAQDTQGNFEIKMVLRFNHLGNGLSVLKSLKGLQFFTLHCPHVDALGFKSTISENDSYENGAITLPVPDWLEG